MSTGLVIPVAFMELGGGEPMQVSLTIDAVGLRLERPDGAVSQVGWSQVHDARCGEPGLAPDGTPGIALAAMVSGRFVRFVVPGMAQERATAINMLLEVRLKDDAAEPEAAVPDRWDVIPVPHEGAANGAVPACALPPPPVGAQRTLPNPPLATLPPPPAYAQGLAVAPPGANGTATNGTATNGADPNGGPTYGAAPNGAPPRDLSQLELPPEVAAVLAAQELRKLPPIGGWDRAMPDASDVRFRRMIKVLVVVVVVFVIAAVVLLAVGLNVKPHHAPHTPRRPSATTKLAKSVAVRVAELPSGWKSTDTATGPLSQLLPRGDGSGLAPGTPPSSSTQSSFASCLHRRVADDVLVGPAGAHPLTRSTSPVYEAPLGGAAMGVATVTSVYGTTSELDKAAKELAMPGFPKCLGTAVGAELLRAAESVPADADATFGALTVSPLALSQTAHVTSAGVNVSVPVSYTGGQTTIDVGFVLVLGGKVETTLVSYAAGGAFPNALSLSLAADLEHEVAATEN